MHRDKIPKYGFIVIPENIYFRKFPAIWYAHTWILKIMWSILLPRNLIMYDQLSQQVRMLFTLVTVVNVSND